MARLVLDIEVNGGLIVVSLGSVLRWRLFPVETVWLHDEDLLERARFFHRSGVPTRHLRSVGEN